MGSEYHHYDTIENYDHASAPNAPFIPCVRVLFKNNLYKASISSCNYTISVQTTSNSTINANKSNKELEASQ